MKTKESLISDVSRFVFGLGIGLALTSAYVIVTSAPDLLGEPAAAEVVRLDPVVVTISSKAFDEIHAEAEQPAKKMHVLGAGLLQVFFISYLASWVSSGPRPVIDDGFPQRAMRTRDDNGLNMLPPAGPLAYAHADRLLGNVVAVARPEGRDSIHPGGGSA